MDWLEHIKKLKKEKGFTNDSLSEASGISAGTLNKLLSGATADPKLSTLLPLAGAFGCTLDELLGLKKDAAPVLPEALARQYRELDDAGREAVNDRIGKEYDRVTRERAAMPYSLDIPEVRRIPLYDIAVSAGTGSYLSGDSYSEIPIYAGPKTDAADFAVRVYGDSMMPRYESGDLLLVSKADGVDVGELGVFSLNGEAFFKKYGGNRLISLNPAYRDILLTENDEITCFGKVIGRLKK